MISATCPISMIADIQPHVHKFNKTVLTIPTPLTVMLQLVVKTCARDLATAITFAMELASARYTVIIAPYAAASLLIHRIHSLHARLQLFLAQQLSQLQTISKSVVKLLPLPAPSKLIQVTTQR